MKKQFLLIVLFLGSITTTNAQLYGESFFLESGVFDFTLGEINGQKGWSSVNSEGATIGGCTISQPIPLSIPENTRPDAAVLRISADPNFGPVAEGSSFGCFSPSLIIPPFVAISGEMAFFLLIDKDNNEQTSGATYEIQMQDAANNSTSKMGFFPDGTIKIFDIIDNVPAYRETGSTWEPHTWIAAVAKYNFITGTVKYLVNGQPIYQGHTLGGLALDRFAILHDNRPGSVAYIKQIFAFGYQASLGNADHTFTSKYSVFPNPTTDLITISNPEKMPIKDVSITDLNGRVIKTFKFDGIVEPQVNISDLAAGMYLMSFSADKEKITTRVIKK